MDDNAVSQRLSESTVYSNLERCDTLRSDAADHTGRASVPDQVASAALCFSFK